MARAASMVLVGLLTIAVACGDDGGGEPIEERIPRSVPDGFPVPADGVISDAAIDPQNHRTEFTITMGSDSLSLIQFFTIELVSQGYVIDRSAGVDDSTWEIEFSQGDLLGTILITDGDGLSRAVVTMNVS
ncbi:MAG: hypothetical protein WEE36_04440 [Acidimicrobiia bacterium]